MLRERGPHIFAVKLKDTRDKTIVMKDDTFSITIPYIHECNGKCCRFFHNPQIHLFIYVCYEKKRPTPSHLQFIHTVFLLLFIDF